MGTVDQALALAAKGHLVFPCKPDKSPACKHGHHDATRDRVAIIRMFRDGLLIGLVCGPGSMLAVLDGDTTRHKEAQPWLDDNAHRLPGREWQTRSGGVHLWFRWVHGVKCIQSNPAPGIDVKGDGGYVIWWGGDDVGRASIDGLAEWPDWLRRLIWPPPKPRGLLRPRHMRPIQRGDPMAGPLRFVGRINEGQRNRAFYWTCRRAVDSVSRGELTRAEAEQTLLGAAMTTSPPMDRREAKRTIDSAFREENS